MEGEGTQEATGLVGKATSLTTWYLTKSEVLQRCGLANSVFIQEKLLQFPLKA